MPRCFLLSLSADLHPPATRQPEEQQSAHTTANLLDHRHTITWSSPYRGMNLWQTSVIESSRPYTYYRSAMTEGSFLHFEHEHHFASMNDGTRMRDEIRFAAPPGILGRLLQGRLRDHLRKRLAERNERIKQIAESEEWRRYLDDQQAQPAPQKHQAEAVKV